MNSWLRDHYPLQYLWIYALQSFFYNPDHTSTPKPQKTYSAAQFKKMDKNQDGFITLKEYIGNPDGRNVPALKKQFSRRDGNGDAKLTLSELNK